MVCQKFTWVKLASNSGRRTFLWQKEVLDSAKDMLGDAIIQNLDIKIMFSSSNTLHIADLGCSVGPNTFNAMQNFKFSMRSTGNPVKVQGMLDESLFDTFNLPMYFPSPEDMTKVVEKNGCFSIEIMELTYPKSKLVEEADAKTL
ncbi:putative caffeine synthase 2 [Capsicum baccatum]|uniref:Caffeine synthase 2 n=1 Tax=Capsicum baccatum TaxID=33114 RepID=A0A2G2XSJ3_CAPBA|nr:putative caffeine synthase 2 [Capsicum baccatum]